MIKFISKYTGSIMYVHEDRVDEYLAAGYQIAPPPPLPEKPVKETKLPEQEKPKTKRKK